MIPTVGSLFSGIGGIDLAFSRAGFDVRWQVEIEPFCQAVLRKHAPQYWPNARIHDDVTKVTGGELGSVDVMVGGFPCQDISIAGNRKGIAKGTRSGLWSEFARLIGEIRPRCVLLENVAAITTLGGTQVVADLAALGYVAEWGIIPASAAGAPHERKRWWCVAYPTQQRRGCWWDYRQHFQLLHNLNRDAPEGEQARTRWERGSGAIGSDVAYANDLGWQSRIRGRGNTPEVASSANQRASMVYSHCQRQSQPQGSEPRLRGWFEYASQAMGNASSEGFQGSNGSKPQFSELARSSTGATQSILGRAVDGLSRRMDIDRWPSRPNEEQQEWEAPRTTTSKVPNRIARVKALGNAVVPQVVYPIAVAIREWLDAAVQE